MSHYGGVPYHLKFHAIRGAKYNKYMYHTFIYLTMKRKNISFNESYHFFIGSLHRKSRWEIKHINLVPIVGGTR